MCNLYRMTKNAAEVADWFKVTNEMGGANFSSEVYPGYPGAVIAEGSARSMVWGFPLVLKSKRTGEPLKPKPVNNTRTDKLDSYMWRYSFAERRCLIPLTAWAEAEGPKGGKTRTWLSLPDADLFAVAGIWRNSDEWGDCYSMVMTDAAGDAAQVHDRMPVVLNATDWSRWTDGPPDEARGMCKAWRGKLTIEQTSVRWTR
ncbi:MAG: SOS response-associated peptidase family protein [Pseudomonadota bacterium]|nr:SOS response-associated peptidase family protein [Pseudomonadota bacterium]